MIGPEIQARSADVQTIRFSAALAASLALLIGFGSSSYGQAPGNPALGGPGIGAPPSNPGQYNPPPAGAGGQAQPQYSQPQAAPPAAPQGAAGGVAPSGRGVGGIGIIDMKFLLGEYEKFGQQMQAIRGRIEAAEGEVRKEQEAMKKMGEQAREFDQNSPNFRQIEQDVMRRNSELQIRVNTQKRQFLDEETRVYYNTGKEVDDAVKVVANRFNLHIVFQCRIEEPNPNNRQEIAMGLTKFIVYNHPQMDITPYVLQELRRTSNVAGGNANPGVSQRPVPTQR
jgi:hypothetical protein